MSDRFAVQYEISREVAQRCRDADQSRPFLRPEDRRHAVVNTPHELVCCGCNDAEGSDPLAGGGVPPVLPKPARPNGDQCALSVRDESQGWRLKIDLSLCLEKRDPASDALDTGALGELTE